MSEGKGRKDSKKRSWVIIIWSLLPDCSASRFLLHHNQTFGISY